MLGLKLFEGEVLELGAHVLHAHAAGERGIDLHRLGGDALAPIRRQVGDGAHIVQAVGQLDEQHAHVGGDGEEELAEVLRLGLFPAHQVEPLDLGQAVDDLADIRAEELVDLGPRRIGVLDGVMQQRHGYRRIVELQIREDRCDFERMGEIRVARGAPLRAVLLHGVDVGLVEKRLVGMRVIRLHPLDELVLTHHGLAALLAAPTPGSQPEQNERRRAKEPDALEI
jgi:hypothetical protein